MSDILLHPSDHKNKSDWEGIFAFLDKNVDYNALSNFVDLGAGMSNIGAHILEENPSCRVVSVDTKVSLLKKSQDRNSAIEILCHDINKPLPFLDQSFDFVSCIGTLHYNYIKDPKFVLWEMGRIARKVIFVDFFVENSLYNRLLSIRHPDYNARRYTRKEAEDLLGSIPGFRIMFCRGGRTPFPRLLPYSGKEVFYLLQK